MPIAHGDSPFSCLAANCIYWMDHAYEWTAANRIGFGGDFCFGFSQLGNLLSSRFSRPEQGLLNRVGVGLIEPSHSSRIERRASAALGF